MVESNAQQAAFEINSDAADRIRIAGQLPTLTQQVAAASCAVTSKVDEQEAHDILVHATQLFDQYLLALRHGDEDLHILGPETRRLTLVDLDHVEEEWMTIHGAIDSIISNHDDVDGAHLIDDHNLKLLELTSILASDIADQYAHPYEISASDLMVMEIVGRQRMLSQRLAKDACEVWTGYHAEEGLEDLIKTMAVFDTSLNALRFGMPEAGIQPAPTPIIEADLDDLLQRWSVIKGNLDILVAGGTLDMDQKYEVFHDLEIELVALDHLLDDYRDYAERAH